MPTIKMVNSLSTPIQTVEPNNNVLFITDKIKSSCYTHCGCTRRIIEKENGSGLFTITEGGIYRILFSSNITTTDTGNVIIDIESNGEPIAEAEIKEAIAVANTYTHVMTFADVVVPCGTDRTISIGNNSTIPVLFQNANIEIKKLF